MPDEGLVSIDEKFLRQGDLFGLKYSDGYVFFEVTGYEQVQYKPYDGIGSVGADTATDFQRLEHDNNDILYVENRDNKILHGAIGMTPGYIRRYTNYPESQNRLRRFPNLPSPRPSSDYGFVDGSESPYNNPTDAEELWIPPDVHLDFAFHNTADRSHTPLLNLKFRSYNTRVLQPGSSEDRNAIRRVVSPGSPMPVAPVGSPDNQDRFRLQDALGVQPLNQSQVVDVKNGNATDFGGRA